MEGSVFKANPFSPVHRGTESSLGRLGHTRRAYIPARFAPLVFRPPADFEKALEPFGSLR